MKQLQRPTLGSVSKSRGKDFDAKRSRFGSTYQLGDLDKLFGASTSSSVKWG